MYCKHCGKEIDDNSTFCKHCGKSQGNTQNGITSKSIWIFYLIWTLANLYLLTGEKYKLSEFYFFPYSRSNKGYYDYSEFIIYVFIIPAILFVVYRRNNEKIDKFINRILNK